MEKLSLHMSQPIAFLNSNDGTGLLAFGDGPSLTSSGENSLEALTKFLEEHNGKYVFGFLSYDLKNNIESLESSNEDRLKIPDLHFWVPETVVAISNGKIEYRQGEENNDSVNVISQFTRDVKTQNTQALPYEFKARIDKETYLDKIKELKTLLQRGDIYEINFCQEFFAENVELTSELDNYFRLNEITKAPFSSFLQLGDHSVFCGSPERYIERKGTQLISQPIKGTAARGKTQEKDEQNKIDLLNDPKERAENVMIVDLVRNDLSKIALKNTVKVDELFGIYSFETVHQMISTISCEIDPLLPFSEVLRATFPMGSMTGAPKYRAMQLIEKFEDFKRGLYSGSIGYIAPNGDFDFNVVIRSLIYNRAEKYLSCAVGSAITINSVPEKEYDECLFKVQRILKGMTE